jgi:hypothetical protein
MSFIDFRFLSYLQDAFDAKMYFLKSIEHITKAFCTFLEDDMHEKGLGSFPSQIQALGDKIFCNSWMLG